MLSRINFIAKFFIKWISIYIFPMDFITISELGITAIKLKKQIFTNNILEEKKLWHFNKCSEVVRRQHLELPG
jgi:hypothetical protein